MQRSTKSKFVLLLLVGLVMLAFIIKMFLHDDKDKDDPGFEGDKDYIYTSPVEGDKPQSEAETNKEQNVPVGNTEVDYEAEYTTKFGEQKINEARQLAEKVMRAWLENNTDMEMWEEISTAPFFIVAKNELLAPMDQLTRKVNSQEVSATKPSSNSDIKLMIFVTWDLLSDGNKVKEQSNMYELTLTLSESGKWLIKELNRA
ncbi:hypothetical protein FC756_16975 [Lysinibacillus mangiferihumi]|uniref:Conjugative transposon protein TcpC n=1 Tax=Lysinibacillus mangiferihumi TaxID=1130819 RepID=A0A4U2YYH6_9BACI|nr:hypothetical protein [Lysinibacillus mangiferihumi]TKI65281.1 hypothetical protein FC756_16975 [Lysinibacillus mangiferihumi]